MDAPVISGPPVGVGLIGAGPVMQAIHVPVVATMPEQMRIAHVMDVDAALASEVVRRAGAARSSTSVEELLADPEVDVVVVGSPHRFHAEQVIAACEAGVRAVLCEKPLATTVADARRVAEVSAATGVPVVVGAMHAYDPAWSAAREAWGDLAATATLIRSVIYLPPNDEFVALATELAPAGAPAGPADSSSPDVRAQLVRGEILGLATHALPQVRQFLTQPVEVVRAAFVAPLGYHLVLASGDRTVELIAHIRGEWAPSWTLDVWGSQGELQVAYPPSYVLGGAARATLRTIDGERVWQSRVSGYEVEWWQVADLARDPLARQVIPLEESVSDLVLACEIADAASGLIGGDGR